MSIVFGDYMPPKKELKTNEVIIGVFFDGTNNNKNNTKAKEYYDKRARGEKLTPKETISADAYRKNGKDKESSSYYNAWSNVARLSDAYPLELTTYIDGIGTETEKADSVLGAGLGTGFAFSGTGILDKVEAGCKEIVNNLKRNSISEVDILYLDVFVFLVILIAILIRYYKNKNKAIELKTSYDTETRIAKKIHDELANDVFQVIAFAESQTLSTENTKENLLQKLDDIYGRVRGISRENNSIDTGINFTKTIKEMLSAYNTAERNIMVTNLEQINWEAIDEMKKITISRILQELMVNMKKHSQANLVVIKFESDQKSILINYMDNGVGCEKSTIVKNGLQNMVNRILAFNGTFDIETAPDKGFKVKITMPEQTQIKA